VSWIHSKWHSVWLLPGGDTTTTCSDRPLAECYQHDCHALSHAHWMAS
jgi:hypothetical protein